MIDKNGIEWVEVNNACKNACNPDKWLKRAVATRLPDGAVQCFFWGDTEGRSMIWKQGEWREIPQPEDDLDWVEVGADWSKVIVVKRFTNNILTIKRKWTSEYMKDRKILPERLQIWEKWWREIPKEPEMVPWDFEDYHPGMVLKDVSEDEFNGELGLVIEVGEKHLIYGETRVEPQHLRIMSEDYVLIKDGKEIPLYKESKND